MADFETRPLSIYRTGEWNGNISGHSAEPGPSSGRAGRASVSGGSISSRRRSTATPAPPAGPPPDMPMPNLPVLSEASLHSYHDLEGDHLSVQQDDVHGFTSPPSPPAPSLSHFQRPTASSQLAAVAQFSQARLAAASPHSTLPSNLSDSPPRSLLRRNVQSTQLQAQAHSREIIPDRLLLIPPESRDAAAPNRPSSRRTLTRALELAREAVRLDSTNDDPHGAIQAYGQSVALLNEVMERVMRGEDNGDHRRRNGRRRSIVAQEDEVRRLKSIHDTYADRMNILSLIYSIPTNEPPLSQTRSRSDSPSSETSRDTQPATTDEIEDSDLQFLSEREAHGSSRNFVPASANGSPSISNAAPNTLSHRSSIERLDAMGVNVSTHRASTTPSKQTLNLTRMRSSSNLPPRPPCPSNSPPSTPTVVESTLNSSESPPLQASSLGETMRSRGNSVSHKRTGSGNRLEALKEEASTSLLKSQQQYHYDHEADLRTHTNGAHSSHRTRESPPLPALPSLPSPSFSEHVSSVTPRGSMTIVDASQQIQPHPPTAVRPRGGSSMSDSTGTKTLINESPMMGTISQRRNKASPSPMVFDASIDGHEGGQPKRLTGSSLPATTVSSLNIGRHRASSHPVRPLNLSIHGPPSDLVSRPFLQTTGQGPSGSQQPRRTSSGFRQSPQPPSRPGQMSSFPPSSFPGLTLTLVPPPPVLPGQLPTTPMSPLPPQPPNDSLRKPYHLMSLLGHTMSSKSGGYITRKLHVPYEVWSQGGAKLTNLPEKIRVVEVLCDALLEIQNASVEFCGPMGVASGMGLGVGSITRKDGEVWISKLEEFLLVCDNVVSSFGKKLGVGEGFAVKKNSVVGSWGGKLTRQLDKLTNGKNLDSPMLYVQGLQKLFQLTQLLDEHTMALNTHPIAPVYAALDTDLRSTLELKLKRSSEFFASVVLTFVIRDLSQLLDKYAKKGEKWLAE